MTPVPDSANGNILIVDDTLTNLRLLSTILTRQGFEVRGVLSGELALQATQRQLPDLILLDIGMPKMDGFEVCKRLQADERTCEVPVIFISAFDEVTDKVKGFEVGGRDYITKPFHWAEVIARVENQLKIRRLSQQLQAQNAQLHQEIQDRVRAESELRFALEKLKTLANLDGLTHIANRRRFDEFLHNRWQGGCSQGFISLILGDVDYFKNYNDTYGHLEGDRCLQQVAHGLQTVINAQESPGNFLLARYGGEEFGILVAQAESATVLHLAKQFHDQIHQLQIPHQGLKHSPWVTMSFGVATLLPTPDQPAHFLIDCADQSLYQAKAEGRDRIVVYSTYPDSADSTA